MIKDTKKKDYPLVSIIMPVYNNADYLVDALNSIISQTYKNWELIVVDDASTDASYGLIKNFSDYSSRIRVVRNKKNVGVGKSLDKGISIAKGDFIARMDADDISFSKRLEWQVEYLLNNLDVVAVGGQVKLMDSKGRLFGKKNFPLSHNELYEMLYYAVPIQHPSLVVNRKLLPKDFSWYDGIRKSQDLHLFFKLTNYGKLGNIEQYVLKYRYYSGGNSLVNPKDTFKYVRRIRKEAIKSFNYRLSFKARIIGLIQNITVFFLPNFAIRLLYPLFRKFIIFVRLPIEKKLEYITEEVIQAPVFARTLAM